ncbi:hypothetical protein STEG23_011060 [Scotinomys teguina]
MWEWRIGIVKMVHYCGNEFKAIPYFLFFQIQDRISLCNSPDCPTSSVDQTGLATKNNGQSLEEDLGHCEPKTKPPSANQTMLEEKVKLEEQLRETMEKYKRTLADTENLWQRSQKLVEEAKLYGIQGFCKDLLEVADVLEKVNQSVPKEEISDNNPHLKRLYEGLVMTEVQIQKVFTKHGLLRLDPFAAKFDPYEHEALFHTPVEGKEPGTVALVRHHTAAPDSLELLMKPIIAQPTFAILLDFPLRRQDHFYPHAFESYLLVYLKLFFTASKKANYSLTFAFSPSDPKVILSFVAEHLLMPPLLHSNHLQWIRRSSPPDIFLPFTALSHSATSDSIPWEQTPTPAREVGHLRIFNSPPFL